MRWKSFFFSTLMTTLLSAMLFFLVVFLGMKYHWIEAFKKDNQQFAELKIPAQNKAKDVNVNDPQIVSSKSADQLAHKDELTTEIIKNTAATSPLANMTKQQVLTYCQKRFSTQGFSEDAITVAVGSCVVNNYQETYEEIAPNDTHFQQVGFVATTAKQAASSAQSHNTQKSHRKNSRQAKVFLDAIRHRCSFEINKQHLLSANEKKLLIETCVTDLSQQ